jgi:glycosyltransferase involved in cell wall biosynthesis
MIVKNEAHCIKKCLESVKPLISYWVICDTGSTDNTVEVIKEVLKDIPGELHHHDWIDFSTNRNKCIDLCKDKGEYIFWIDADDYIECDDFSFIKELNFDLYYIKIMHDSIQYNRIHIFKSSKNFKFVGVLHEYLNCEESTRSGFISNLKLIFGGNGFRSKNDKKYLDDAKLLENELIREPNNSRNMFYCAQSYRDAKEYEKALEYYLKRSKMGGWNEEVFYSLFQAGKLMVYLKYDFATIETTYIKAYNACPSRAESLCYLCMYYRDSNLFDKSYFFAKIASRIVKPNNGLFVENSCYDWRIFDELAISAYYVGYINESKNINLMLLNKAPEDQKERIANNIKFCK